MNTTIKAGAAFLFGVFVVAVIVIVGHLSQAKAANLIPGVDITGGFTAANARYIDGIDVTGHDPGGEAYVQLQSGWVYVRGALGNDSVGLLGVNSDAAFSAGLKHRWDLGFGGIDFDFGGTYRQFYGDRFKDCMPNPDFWQFYGKAGGDFHGFRLTGVVEYSPDVFRGMGAYWRFEGGAQVPLVTVSGVVISGFTEAAYNTLSQDSLNYEDESVGLMAEKSGYFGRAYYHLTQDLPSNKWNSAMVSDRIVVEVGAKFD